METSLNVTNVLIGRFFFFFFCLKCNCEAKNLPNLTTLDSGVLQKVVVLVVLIFFLTSQQSSPHFFFPEVFSLVSRRCLWTEMVYFGPFSPAAEALLPTSFRSLFVSVYIFHAKHLRNEFLQNFIKFPICKGLWVLTHYYSYFFSPHFYLTVKIMTWGLTCELGKWKKPQHTWM